MVRKHIFPLLLALLPVAAVFAQSAEELKRLDPKYYHELYRPYPAELITPQTPAPKGYTPFYISHLSRHGSRWHSTERVYTDIFDIFAAAHEAGELTPAGERFFGDWTRVCADAKGRAGELSPAGIAEQRAIAGRMYRAYPELFSTKHGRRVVVNCRSTVVPRCIHSMANFALSLTSLDPKIEVNIESSHANDRYLAAYGNLNAIKSITRPLSDSLCLAYMPDAQPFMARLFKPGSRVVAERIADAKEFMHDMYIGNANLGANSALSLDTFSYLFTEEELAAAWRASNLRRYVIMAHSARFADMVLGGARPMVENIVESADRAIAGGGEQATLRFAHDVTVIPILHLLGVRSSALVSDDYASVGEHWQVNVVTPMATNVQLVFYRNRQGDVLVKVLHCEREQVLSAEVGEPVAGCYYRWTDLRRHLLGE